MNKMSDQEKAFVKRQLRKYLSRPFHVGPPVNGYVGEPSLCPVCTRSEVSEFEVLGYREDRFYTSAIYNYTERTPTKPVVVVSCPGCGLMLAFDAVTLGICDADTGCLVDGWDEEAVEP